MADDNTLVDDSGQVYDVVADDGGWVNSAFGLLTAGVNAVGSYFKTLPTGQNTLGAGSGQASTTASGNVWDNLVAGVKNALVSTPQAQSLIQSGAQSTAQQTAGAWIMNPITWVIAGVGLVAMIFLIARNK